MNLHSATMDDELVFSLKLDGLDKQIGKHFKLVEFACKDGSDTVWLHPALVAGLDKLREASGAPVTLTNAYRTPSHNAKVGGRQGGEMRQSGSRPLYGQAADVVSHAWKPKEVADWAEGQGFGGVGRYKTFTHVDVWGKDRRWNG